jgi:DNA repair exonuclease SbcCD ATPase subunit
MRWHHADAGEYTQAMKRHLVLLCLCFTAKAQNSPSDPQTLQTLLSEVHQLRLAIEHSSQVVPRIQIVVERLKMQQEQVARTTRQLDDLRRDLERSRSDLPRMRQRLDTVAAESDQLTDPAKRRENDETTKMLKLDIEQSEKLTQQLQAREGELASQLQSEQLRLSELNDRLDQIERALNLP